ncbi:ABC transporter permease subunit [Sinimarinibacterium thermocellulolyticum]|uniref:ABC transporter permease subunit n=1 Tax=Sinimarinibacterium thermocellulolyticum TaxID=3170016 RepID=A0ABV2A6F8_9GAMM
MTLMLLRRAIAGLVTLFALLTLSFFLLRAAPGGPLDRERSLPPRIEAAIAAQYHLDEPLWRQYVRYAGDVLRGDLGPSFQYDGYHVSDLIAAGLPASLLLGALALALALPLGIVLGFTAAQRPGGWRDRALTLFSMTGVSLPNFVVAPLLVLVFAVTLRWLPAGGWRAGAWQDVVLPVIALALPQMAYVARLARAGMIETLAAPFMLTARAKGLPPRLLLWRHAFRPALLPVLSYLGPAAAGLLTGSVVVEQIFGIPGIGRYFVQGALNRDYTLVLGVVLLYGALIVLFNLLVDLLYGWLDPRLRSA